MQINIQMEVNETGSNAIKDALKSQLGGGAGPLYDVFIRSAEAVRSHLYNRFISGADWPPLAASTIKRKGHNRILQDTMIMLGALTPSFIGLPGQYQNFSNGNMEIGIAGYTYMNGMPIETVVNIHQNGLGNNPRREIFVAPDEPTITQITKNFDDAITQIIEVNNVK